MTHCDSNEASIDFFFCLLWDIIGLLINVKYIFRMKYFTRGQKSTINFLEVPSTWVNVPFMNEMSFVWIEKTQRLVGGALQVKEPLVKVDIPYSITFS